MALIECPGCKGPLSTTAEACPRCGRDVSAESFTCYECGAKAPGNSEYCPACGCPLKPKSSGAPAAAPATRPCPGCDRPIDAGIAACPHCSEEVLGKVVSFCPRCRDEYIVAEADKTFTCPRCSKVCDIAEGIRMLQELEAPGKAKRGLPRRRSTLRPGGKGKPALAAQVKPDSGHRFCAGVMIATTAIFFFQLVTVSSVSEESVLRNHPFYSLLSEEKREQALHEMKEKKKWFMIVKGIGALLLAGVAAGLLLGRRSPTRALAAVAAVPLGIGTIFIVTDFYRVMDAISSSAGALAWLDAAMTLMIPVSFVCCFIAAGSRLWKESRAGVAGARLQRPRRGPAPKA